MSDADREKAIERAVQKERERCLAIIEMHRRDLDREGDEVSLYIRLWNLINSGRDVADPDDQEDRLPGF